MVVNDVICVYVVVVDCGVQFRYETDEPVKAVSLEVVWNDEFIVDDNYGITSETFIFHSEKLTAVAA